MSTAFGAKMPPYLTVLELDRKIRDFPVPVYLRPICETGTPPVPDSDELPEVHMQRWWVLSNKEASTHICCLQARSSFANYHSSAAKSTPILFCRRSSRSTKRSTQASIWTVRHGNISLCLQTHSRTEGAAL
jgi:hypothetical protein